MKTLLISLIVGLMVGSEEARRKDTGYGYGGGYGTGSNPRSERVDGYTKRDGTYVEPYQRSKGNDTQRDNWNTKGNTNPYTGKSGTRNPYK